VKKRPIGRACAILEPHATGGAQAKFIDLGAVWQTEGGNLILTLDVQPVVWNDPFVKRTILIKPVDEGVFTVSRHPAERSKEKVDYNPEEEEGGGKEDLPF